MTIPSKTQRILGSLAGAAASIAGITALVVTVFGWPADKTTTVISAIVFLFFIVGFAIDKAIERINKNLDSKLIEIKNEITKNETAAQARSRVHDLSLCRLELSDLMNNDPDNRVAIRKKARHYFCELQGNDWMSDRYTGWAEKYDNGDLSIIYQDRK